MSLWNLLRRQCGLVFWVMPQLLWQLSNNRGVARIFHLTDNSQFSVSCNRKIEQPWFIRYLYFDVLRHFFFLDMDLLFCSPSSVSPLKSNFLNIGILICLLCISIFEKCEVMKFNAGDTTLREDILCFKNNKGNICFVLKIIRIFFQ